jgi:hypothetical protein
MLAEVCLPVLLQRVLESLAKLRLAFPPATHANKDLEEFKTQHDGKDPFGEFASFAVCSLYRSVG